MQDLPCVVQWYDAHISPCHGPLSIFSDAGYTMSSVPMLTDGSAATTTGWQLSIGGAAGAASSTTESKNKKQRVTGADTADSSGTPDPANKKRGKGKNTTKGKALEDPIMLAMARLTLQSTQQHKVWETSLLDTYLISSTAPTIIAAREAGRQYHLEIQSATAARRAELGPPHIHVHRALILTLVSLLKEMNTQPEALALLLQQEQWLSQVSLEVAEEAITVTKVSQTRQTAFSRLHVRVQDENLPAPRAPGIWQARPLPVTTRGYFLSISTTARTWKFDPR